MLLEQIKKKKSSVRIRYSRVAKYEGNPTALALLERVFEPCDAEWRGLGIIPRSGLKLRSQYARFNAHTVFRISDFRLIPQSAIRNPQSTAVFAEIFSGE
ncbi:MAG: hypothetical protein A2069_04990 [Planctomycetes bacterium GWB2_41_19]|nr:MAG: hypothetical protein A2069_04990 [Planctomycetes bacterium GWB2_41_19]